MCWITIPRISPHGRSQLIMVFPGNVSLSLRKEGIRYISNCLQQACVLGNILNIFPPPVSRLALACMEKGICLFLCTSVSACTQGCCSVKKRRVGIYGRRRTGTLDTYQKVSEQYIQMTVQQHTFSGWWLKWSNPAPVNSCLHSGHCCFSICKELKTDGLSPGLLDKQFLFMELLGDEMFRYLGMPWKPGGIRGRDFYGRCLCKLSTWLFWRSLQRLKIV